MSTPSRWPLSPESNRFVIPRKIVHSLSENPLSEELYPLGIGYYQQARGHNMRRPVHDDNLLIYCLDGKGKLTLGDRQITIRSGDLMILPAGTAHAYSSSDKVPWTIYWIHFSGSKSHQFIDNIFKNSESEFRVPLGLHSRLVTDFENLLEARQRGYKLDNFVHAANQLRQILSHIALLAPLAKVKPNSGLDLEKIHTLMQARIHEPLDLDTLAESVSLSKYHFVKRYKALTGDTPINHFINLKIDRACRLLDTSTKSINEISFAVGYEDAYYFSRIFKKVMGISPTQYRKMRLGDWPYQG